MAFAHPCLTVKGRIPYAPSMAVAETMIKALVFYCKRESAIAIKDKIQQDLENKFQSLAVHRNL